MFRLVNYYPIEQFNISSDQLIEKAKVSFLRIIEKNDLFFTKMFD
jgi:hypothetical protein